MFTASKSSSSLLAKTGLRRTPRFVREKPPLENETLFRGLSRAKRCLLGRREKGGEKGKSGEDDNAIGLERGSGWVLDYFDWKKKVVKLKLMQVSC